MAYAVRFEEVSKRYPRGGPRYASLRQELADGLRRLGRRLRGGADEPRGTLALDRVSFDVQEGEAFAIIGPNGAGKTTALKLISRITYPTAGRVRVRGRVGALIEVGSGVHPELTARENIWLYGQILGMSKADIRRRFDQIVEFAELGHVLDTPVKMYSTGMQLRLGFSIASHLDPDVFVVDEALAVGDAGFQAKCVERMTGLVTEGKTLLFVSHNLSAVEALCSQGLMLVGGGIQAIGQTRELLSCYMDWIDSAELLRRTKHASVQGRGIVLRHVTIHDEAGVEQYQFRTGDTIHVRLHVHAAVPVQAAWFSVGISDGRPGILCLATMLEEQEPVALPEGEATVSCRLGPLPLGPRTYDVWASIREPHAAADLLEWKQVASFRIEQAGRVQGPAGTTAPWLYGPVRIPYEWRLT